MTQIWTSRDVEYALYPRTPDETFDAFFTALPDHYWETWRHWVFGTLCIASHGLDVTIGGWQWWVPGWLARRSVAKVAAAYGAGGEARFVVSRSVLSGDPESSTP